MKYIRTKDGIYNAIKEFKIGEMICVPYNGLVKIIAQADTIEELCDEFVYLMESGRHICKAKHTDIMYAFDNDKPVAYYGAIWTDKGLIYVAKMNDKGDLCLI